MKKILPYGVAIALVASAYALLPSTASAATSCAPMHSRADVPAVPEFKSLDESANGQTFEVCQGEYIHIYFTEYPPTESWQVVRTEGSVPPAELIYPSRNPADNSVVFIFEAAKVGKGTIDILYRRGTGQAKTWSRPVSITFDILPRK